MPIAKKDPSTGALPVARAAAVPYHAGDRLQDPPDNIAILKAARVPVLSS
jgi:hypothetical protein